MEHLTYISKADFCKRAFVTPNELHYLRRSGRVRARISEELWKGQPIYEFCEQDIDEAISYYEVLNNKRDSMCPITRAAYIAYNNSRRAQVLKVKEEQKQNEISVVIKQQEPPKVKEEPKPQPSNEVRFKDKHGQLRSGEIVGGSEPKFAGTTFKILIKDKNKNFFDVPISDVLLMEEEIKERLEKARKRQ